MKHAEQGIEERLSELERMVDKIDRSVEKIELITLIREPNLPIAADAYNGLRKQVIAATSERSAHLHQLALFSDAVDDSIPYERLRQMVDEWMHQASLVMVNDPGVPDFFDIIGGDGEALEVVTPAYYDAVTRRPVKMGRARRTSSSRGAPAPHETAPHETAPHETAPQGLRPARFEPGANRSDGARP